MSTIAENLKRIREYTRDNPQLLQAHHFCYGLPLNSAVHAVEYIVIGINPGETQGDDTGSSPSIGLVRGYQALRSR